MERDGNQIHVSETEARSGTKLHVMRYVLLGSMVLALIALAVVWIMERRPG